MLPQPPNLLPIILAVLGIVLVLSVPQLFPLILLGMIIFALINRRGRRGGGGLFPDLSQFFPSQNREEIIADDVREVRGRGPRFPNVPNFSPFNMPPNFPLFKILLALGGVFAVFAVIADGIYTVPAGHVGVIFSRGSGVLETPSEPGIHLKVPWWQSVTVMNTRLQTYTMSANLSESDLIANFRASGGAKYADSSRGELLTLARRSGTGEENTAVDALTSDGQRVNVDLTVQFSIDADAAPKVYRDTGLDFLDKVVRPASRSVTREVITNFESRELFANEARQRMAEEIRASLTEKFASRNLRLQDILVRHVGFSEVYLGAIEEKQIAEQRVQKAEFEKQEAEVRKEKTIIEATAEAEAIRLRGESLAESPEVIQLEFVQKMAPEINWGILPDGALPLLNMSTFR